MSCYRHQQLGFGILLECLFPYWSTHSELGEPCPRSLVRNAGKATSRRRRSALTVGPANRPPITTQQGFRRCSALHHSPSSPSSEPLSKLCLAYYEEARRRAIDRTKTGPLLLGIGFFMGWIPFVGVIGSPLEIVRAAMVIVGRHAFGPEHSRNVIQSIVIFIVGVAASVATVLVAIFTGNILLNALPSLVPAVIFGYAYNLARNRVERREIPGPALQSPSSFVPGG